MDKISIVIPSYCRPQLLRECLDSIGYNTSLTNEYEIEVVVVVDDDINTLIACEHELRSDKFKLLALYTARKTSNIAAWNEGTRIATGNIFLHFGDDSILAPGALSLVYNKWVEMGRYGLVGFNDLMHSPQADTGMPIVITTPLYDRDFCRHYLGGVMVVPHYKAYCADLEFHQRALKSGKVAWLEDAIAEHKHSANGKRPLDEFEKLKVNYWDYDTILFQVRKAAGFPDDFEPVI